MVQEATDKIWLIQDRLLISQSQQKSYTNHRHQDLEFEVGDHVVFRVSPIKGIMRFGKNDKLNSRYIRPYEILKRVDAVAYRLALPPDLSSIHLVFHLSIICKYNPNPTHVLHHEEIQVGDDLLYKEVSIEILDRQIKQLRTKDVALVNVLLHNHSNEKVTWKAEDEICMKYMHLFQN
ncbi:PREDICTED: uncharacterized protein LOC108663228 [Theobroma cacao]|uniref:Uncharacterized protein LOC108663228 n=1 Tax=Theobroma cacao TaxID=3641 RepID=A0AB32WUG2_THECC|nr:PREDICTED: uncharacterized protein LOC108663228 [Theobroma cacao]